jgi:hypothetical protein
MYVSLCKMHRYRRLELLERERVCVCVCVCSYARARHSDDKTLIESILILKLFSIL